ncbi:NUDIX domain-containing protein [Streptomyces typhae]|nr:NUDIX hydrolase [Streptomyces typhae]
MVKPTSKHADSESGWQLPGGRAHAGETIAAAAVRELFEETGVRCHIAHALVIDQVPADEDGKRAEGYDIVVEGSTLTTSEAAAVTLPESARAELSDLRWVPLEQLDQLAFPRQAGCVKAAVRAYSYGMRIPLYRLGRPADAR